MIRETSFGTWLRSRRRLLDLTQQALADQVGCARITVRRIESGALKPSRELALVLLEKLGIPEIERPQWSLFARGLAGLPTKPGASFAHRPGVPSGEKPLTNLPLFLTTFIGRKKEQAEIIRLISKYRLVTLTGSGGIGKTRLAVKVGEQLLADYGNGVWLAELASLSDPELLPQTVAGLFGLAAQSNIPSTAMLVNFLRTKTLLLVLDNCEHLLNACALLADSLLKNCPKLKIIATSREALGIMGEVAYRVPSLQLLDGQQAIEKIREYESIRLFEERCQLVQPDFKLTMENVASVAQICNRLDGIPLAIELAAGRVNIFSPEQIAIQLNECFRILTGGSRTALPRQQTIRASMDWSWNLLTDSECILLQRLSVFAGGWTLDAAGLVCNGDGMETNRVSEVMIQLAEKSLVIVEQGSGSARRYHLLETIRQYAHEKLIETSEHENIRTQHLRYFLALSEQAGPALKGPAQVEWLRRLHNERDNIRSALEWASETNVEAGLALPRNLGVRFWESFNLQEGVHWLTEALHKPGSQAYPGARAKALYLQGFILVRLQQLDQARSAAEECLELYRACQDQRGEIDGLMVLAFTIYISGNLMQAMELAQQALALAQSLGDPWREAMLLFHLSLYDSDFTRAFADSEQAISLFRQLKDWSSLALCLGSAGEIALRQGHIQLAEKYVTECLPLSRQLNFKAGSIKGLTIYGLIAFSRGECEQARASMQESIAISQEIGNRNNYLWSRARLGYIIFHQGDMSEARAIFSETAQDFKNDHIEIGVVYTLEGLASLSVLAGNPDKATRLIGWADATRKKTGGLRPPIEQKDVDRDEAACRLTLGEAAFTHAYEAGRAMTLEQAVTYALEEN
jgi:predicted ATPase/DNA-binding XRE family transcriptional regulator